MRPLLHISREDIEYFVRNIKVVRDPTNDNIHYRRNLLRHEIIPYLEKYNPNLKQFLPDLMKRVKEYK
jgi:tRNA(Ile)-lysidine synthase